MPYLFHGSSRKVVLKDKKVLKFYPPLYGYFFHEISRIIFSFFFGTKVRFLSPKERIANEIKARKILRRYVDCTKLSSTSFKNFFITEVYEKDLTPLSKFERKNPSRALVFARKIGKITKKLNSLGFFFIDNRASNWLVGKKLKRTDLELFTKSKKHQAFFSFCDILSFTSSVSRISAREFLKGYGMEEKPTGFLEFLARVYLKITNLLF